MATFIQTDDFTTTTPDGASSIIRDAQYGIDATLAGYIIQNVTVNTTRVYDQTFSQKNMLVSELDTDEQQELTMTVIGGDGAESGALSGVVPGDTAFTWDSKTWKVRSVQYTGAYNDKKTYQITAIRNHAFPSGS